MTKLREDRRRKAEGTHLSREIKLRVCETDFDELVDASRVTRAENLTGYARDCMFIGHKLMQTQRAQILAALVGGEELKADALQGLLADLAQLALGVSLDDMRAA